MEFWFELQINSCFNYQNNSAKIYDQKWWIPKDKQLKLDQDFNDMIWKPSISLPLSSTNIRKPNLILSTKESHIGTQSNQTASLIENSDSKVKAKTNEPSPILHKKKKRKEWRIGKSGKYKIHGAEMVNQKQNEFYSLGNSITNGESISISSAIQVNSQIPSAGESKSISSFKKCKTKLNKVDLFNFSDRTLSSKLFSVKRKEIYLFDKKMGSKIHYNKVYSKHLSEDIEFKTNHRAFSNSKARNKVVNFSNSTLKMGNAFSKVYK